MLKNKDKTGLCTLNPQQEEAVFAPSGPLLIVAGAGTGKTTTLAARLAHFIKEGIPPQRICAITFTNKAANEMRERVPLNGSPQKMGGKENYQPPAQNNPPFIGTFHSLGAKILRREAALLGRNRNFVIFDDHDSFGLLKKIAKELFAFRKNKSGEEGGGSAKNEKPAVFAKKISEIKNTRSALADLEKSEKEADGLTLEMFRRYEASLRENNAFDFDDLVEKTVYLFEKRPEILKKYREKFDAILVDEYQDINHKQCELIKLLAAGHKNLSAVGDDEQMIYGWRYASMGIFLGFERNWPDAQIKFLEENYRSTQNIISAASAIAKNNQYRRPKNLWTKNASGELIKIAEFEDENGEAEWIANRISDIRSQMSDVEENLGPGVRDLKSDVRNQSTAVLYRTNAQSRAIEQALINNKIPYRIFGGLKFYERMEIKDIVAALRYATNKKDELSRDRLIKNIGKRKFQEFAEAMSHKNTAGDPPLRIVEKFLKVAGYLKHLEKNFLNYAERQENIAELVEFARRFEEPSKFLEEVALTQATDTAANNPGQIANENSGGRSGKENQGIIDLTTIHLAKGLEFDCVFIAGCSEGILPHARSLGSEYDTEEERRLMYVAMTRAKKSLYISFYDVPSRFLGEIPREFAEMAPTAAATDEENVDEESWVAID